jgi:hypothetical protein
VALDLMSVRMASGTGRRPLQAYRREPADVLSSAYLRTLPPSLPFEHCTNTLFVVFINP